MRIVLILHIFFIFNRKKKFKIFGGCNILQYFCIANENCNLLDV